MYELNKKMSIIDYTFLNKNAAVAFLEGDVYNQKDLGSLSYGWICPLLYCLFSFYHFFKGRNKKIKLNY